MFLKKLGVTCPALVCPFREGNTCCKWTLCATVKYKNRRERCVHVHAASASCLLPSSTQITKWNLLIDDLGGDPDAARKNTPYEALKTGRSDPTQTNDWVTPSPHFPSLLGTVSTLSLYSLFVCFFLFSRCKVNLAKLSSFIILHYVLWR